MNSFEKCWVFIRENVWLEPPNLLLSVACPGLQHFPDYLTNGRFYEKKIFEREMCV